MATVPLELYRIIIENITDSTTLATALLVSRDFYREAERCLYATIVISFLKVKDDSPGTIKAIAQQIKEIEMLLELVQSPHLAAHLIHLNMHALEREVEDMFTSQWGDFKRGMAVNCLNLKSLHLPFYPLPVLIPPVASSFKLHTLIMECAVLDDYASFNALGPFLGSQPEIEHLVLPHLLLEPLPSYALPKLHTLLAPTRICLWLVPIRPISQLELRDGINNLLFDGFGPLPYLKRLITPAPASKLLCWFTDSFKYLEHLEVGLVFTHFVAAA